MIESISLRYWINEFREGVFESNDLNTQMAAGWKIWFCTDKSLAGRTKEMGNIIKQIKHGPKVNLDKTFVWFKYDCQYFGKPYNSFRISHLKTGKTIYAIYINSYEEEKMYTVYGKENDFFTPIYSCDTSKELVKWFNEGLESKSSDAKTYDSVVRAIAITTNKSLLDCKNELLFQKKELECSSYKDAKFLNAYFKRYPKYTYKALKDQPRISVIEFIELHPKGTYIIKMDEHLTACIDGVIHDDWDCSMKSVYCAWEIKA